jgi:DNA-directed RNA polymerase specialized sigma24 family protein
MVQDMAEVLDLSYSTITSIMHLMVHRCMARLIPM